MQCNAPPLHKKPPDGSLMRAPCNGVTVSVESNAQARARARTHPRTFRYSSNRYTVTLHRSPDRCTAVWGCNGSKGEPLHRFQNPRTARGLLC